VLPLLSQGHVICPFEISLATAAESAYSRAVLKKANTQTLANSTFRADNLLWKYRSNRPVHTLVASRDSILQPLDEPNSGRGLPGLCSSGERLDPLLLKAMDGHVTGKAGWFGRYHAPAASQ
jgi:hypothetical protein